jgi:hypothetical protein
VGRVFTYAAVGLVENVSVLILSDHQTYQRVKVVPTYHSEISPAPLRGFFVGSIQLFLVFGSLFAGIVNNFMAKKMDDSGWQIATALQFAPALLILIGLPFTPSTFLNSTSTKLKQR